MIAAMIVYGRFSANPASDIVAPFLNSGKFNHAGNLE